MLQENLNQADEKEARIEVEIKIELIFVPCRSAYRLVN